MRAADVRAALDVRLSTRENAITADELARDFGVTVRSVEEAMRADVAGWLCEDADRVVGFAMGDRSNGEVLVVAVLPCCEGRGIGRTLLGHVQDWLFSQGHEELMLLANPDPTIRAARFYERAGWESTGIAVGNDVVMKLRRPGSG